MMEQELAALRERLVKEKAAMDELKQRNEALTAQLQQVTTTNPLDTSRSPSEAGLAYSAASSASTSTISYHHWVDEVQNSMNYRQYREREQAVFLYDHLEGGAKQEIRYSTPERCNEETGGEIRGTCTAGFQNTHGSDYIALVEGLEVDEGTLPGSLIVSPVWAAQQRIDPIIGRFLVYWSQQVKPGRLARAKEDETVDEWVVGHQERFKEAYQKAREQMEHAAEVRKRQIGPPSLQSSLQVGQLVYRRNHSFSGRHKIQDLWMPAPFKVIAQPDNTKAVYTVAPVDGSCPPKNVHRTELRPCGPGVVESFHQNVQSHSDVVSDSESDDAWVIRGKTPTESLQRARNGSDSELGSEAEVDLGEQVGLEESQTFEVA
ncbi:Cell division protein FtsB [Labeo rohita]|uniref:Cell division protein FtsB n=1 Tax=Labeo rohita TaxID=84645 RepID=A0ABQ8M340_LABRO|nr:Cell division protein FtsB [Labeo rohita]